MNKNESIKFTCCLIRSSTDCDVQKAEAWKPRTWDTIASPVWAESAAQIRATNVLVVPAESTCLLGRRWQHVARQLLQRRHAGIRRQTRRPVSHAHADGAHACAAQIWPVQAAGLLWSLHDASWRANATAAAILPTGSEENGRRSQERHAQRSAQRLAKWFEKWSAQRAAQWYARGLAGRPQGQPEWPQWLAVIAAAANHALFKQLQPKISVNRDVFN